MKNKSRIVIIGAGLFQEPLILKARKKGLETHVFAWDDGAVGKACADFFYPISITEKEEILRKCEEIKPAGIVSVGSDLAALTVNYLTENLRLNGNDISSGAAATNKYKMRQIFTKHDLPVPKFNETDKVDYKPESMTFPLIVKPTDRSGSRGVTKTERPDELPDAISRALEASFEKKAIIEEFVEGNEYSVEYISYKGCHTFLAITKKYTTGAPNFIETGHVIPAGLPENIIEKIKIITEGALDALSMKNGASHTEIKIDGEKITIIETGLRMGGDFIGSDLVELATGHDFLSMVINTALDKAPDFTNKTNRSLAAVRFVFNSDDVERIEKARAVLPEAIVSFDYNQEMVANQSELIQDSSARLGYAIFRAEPSQAADLVKSLFD